MLPDRLVYELRQNALPIEQAQQGPEKDQNNLDNVKGKGNATFSSNMSELEAGRGRGPAGQGTGIPPWTSLSQQPSQDLLLPHSNAPQQQAARFEHACRDLTPHQTAARSSSSREIPDVRSQPVSHSNVAGQQGVANPLAGFTRLTVQYQTTQEDEGGPISATGRERLTVRGLQTTQAGPTYHHSAGPVAGGKRSRHQEPHADQADSSPQRSARRARSLASPPASDSQTSRTDLHQ